MNHYTTHGMNSAQVLSGLASDRAKALLLLCFTVCVIIIFVVFVLVFDFFVHYLGQLRRHNYCFDLRLG